MLVSEPSVLVRKSVASLTLSGSIIFGNAFPDELIAFSPERGAVPSW